MRPSKIRVAKYEHSVTSKWVVEGLKNNKGKRSRKFFRTRAEADDFARNVLQGHSLKATAALLGLSEDQVALETHEDWYAASIDPTDLCHRAIRVLKELTASEKSKSAAADSRKCLRKFWGKASKIYNDTKMDIH